MIERIVPVSDVRLKVLIGAVEQNIGQNCEEWDDTYAALMELAQHRQDVDGGQVVELPCKVGDTMYFWTESFDDDMPQPYVSEFQVRGIQIMHDGIYVFDGDCWNKIGTQFAYLTRAEAEAALLKEGTE